MKLLSFKSLAGVPLHYDRYDQSSGFGYGTRGKPFTPSATREMIETLEGCFADIFNMAPFDSPEVITSAGAFVGKEGHHGEGNAFDLDGIFWRDHQLIALHFPTQPHLYLAVEAIIRMHFGTVLAYNYNAAHRDHLHLDRGTEVGFNTMSKSRVEFVQAALLYIHGYQIGVDGVWGPATAEVVRMALRDLGFEGNLSAADVWEQFLQVTQLRGFGIANDSASLEDHTRGLATLHVGGSVAFSGVDNDGALAKSGLTDFEPIGDGRAAGKWGDQVELHLHSFKGEVEAFSLNVKKVGMPQQTLDSAIWKPEDFADADGRVAHVVGFDEKGPGPYIIGLACGSLAGGAMIVELQVAGVVVFRQMYTAKMQTHIRLLLS